MHFSRVLSAETRQQQFIFHISWCRLTLLLQTSKISHLAAQLIFLQPPAGQQILIPFIHWHFCNHTILLCSTFSFWTDNWILFVYWLSKSTKIAVPKTTQDCKMQSTPLVFKVVTKKECTFQLSRRTWSIPFIVELLTKPSPPWKVSPYNKGFFFQNLLISSWVAQA